MKGWQELCGDVNWEDYGGMWAKKSPDGSWYVLRWTNLVDAMGKEAPCKYECDVKRMDLADMPAGEIDSALRCCGYKRRVTEDALVVEQEHDGELIAEGEHAVLMLVECCIQYGLGAPLESFEGDKYPLRIRAEARRYAESCMADAELLSERLARPVNAIGSTAAEYGRGDINTALSRGPFDAGKNLMRKMHGLPPENETTFGTLQPDGTPVNVRRIKHSDLRKCPFAILVPEHYREDGSCRCDDPEHRKMMIAEWEYSEEDFADIPLREATYPKAGGE